MNSGQENNALHDIIREYVNKFKGTQITITIKDNLDNEYTIINKGKYDRNKYTIRLASYNESLVDGDENVYFVLDLQELREILDYMLDNPDVFTTPQTEDVFDNCEVVSLDQIIKENEDEDIYDIFED